jgi:4-amino-4-deoxy-L-arabinose transferase-like glycosyltransferase/tetratricopeptide (TPR) repeat protein
MPYFNYPTGDSVVYLDWARNIANGDLLSLREPYNVFYRAPLYPYLLALFLKVFGNSLLPVYILQLLLGTVNLLLAYVIARRLFSHRAGLAAVVMAALYAALTFKESKIVSVTLTITLTLLAAWYLLKAQDGRPRLRWFLSGVFLGIATLAWGGTLVLVPLVFVFWLFLKPRPRFALPALLAIGWFVAILPATLHNVFAGNDLVLVNSNSGYTFYQGNCQVANGMIAMPPEVYERTYNGRYPVYITDQEAFDRGYASAVLKPAQRGQEQELVKPSEASGFWLRRGLDYLAKNPSSALRLLFQKLTLTLSNLEMASNYSEYVEKENVPILRFAFVPFALLLALGLMGMVYAWRERGRQWPLYLLLAGTALTLLVFYVGSRYRLPLVLPLAVFAGVGLDRIIRRVQQRKVPFAEAGLAGVVLLVSWVFCTVPYGGRNTFVTALGYRNLGEAYHRQAGNATKARAAYNRALDLFARNGGVTQGPVGATAVAELHTMRGDVFVEQGRYDSALADFHTALAIDSRAPQPLSKLAFAFYSEAIREYKPGTWQSKLCLDSALAYAQQWQEAETTSTQPLALLGDVYLSLADTGQALESYRQLTMRSSQFAPPYFAMASIYLARRDTVRALETYEQLVSADSTNPIARVAIGDILAAQKDTSGARAEYLMAGRLDTLAVDPMNRLVALHTAARDFRGAVQTATVGLGRIEGNKAWLKTLLAGPAANAYFELKLRLSAAYMNLGEWDRAQQQAEEVLKFAPEHPAARQLLDGAKQKKIPEFLVW